MDPSNNNNNERGTIILKQIHERLRLLKILGAASLMLLAACSSNNGAVTNSPTAATGGQATPGAVATEQLAPKLDKNAKLRIAVPDNASVPGFEEGASENKNRFLDALKEKTGYTNIEWNVIPVANQLDKYNLMFASGDVYDLIYSNDQNVLKRFTSQGALLALDDLIDQYGNEIASLVPDSSWLGVSVDGRKYAIPVPPYSQYEGVDLGGGLLMRTDWMEQLNLNAPSNLEEFYTFLKTIKEADPSGKGTIPYVAAAGDNGNPLDGLNVITGAFGMANINNLAVPFVVQDGELVDAQDLYLRDLLEYVSKLYAEGLIDSEYLFNKGQQVTEKMSSGQAASTDAGYWTVNGILAGLEKVDSNARLEFLPPITGPDGRKGYSMPAPVSNFHIIPKNAKHPAEAIDFLNSYLGNKELQTFVNFGEEGVHYEKVDGRFTPISPAYDNIKYKIYYRLWTTPDIWLPNALLAGYEKTLISYAASGPHLTAFNINHFRPQSETELAKGRSLLDLRNEYVSKIINGALPLDAIDEYFQKADAAGRQEVIKESQDWYAKEGKAIYEQLK